MSVDEFVPPKKLLSQWILRVSLGNHVSFCLQANRA